MFAVCVTFDIHPEQFEAFLPLMMCQAETSLTREAGCHRFDVCTAPKGVARVFLYELYSDSDAFDQHLATPHFLTFDKAVADMVAQKSVATYDLIV